MSLEMSFQLTPPETSPPTPVKINFFTGDCLTIIQNHFPDDTFDLIITSPPYADSREKNYGGIPPERYVEWFLPRAAEFQRVLKPTGTFILNIKEGVVRGERHTYVLELILALRRQGWLWTEEYIWHKKNSYPGKWPNRFRDAWERCLQFNRQRKFRMYQEAVRTAMGDWRNKRLKSLKKNDLVRSVSQSGSRFGKRIANWQERELAYPTNVLHLATETRNRQHSASFPLALPEWFIRLFTREGDWVLDPFVGSGTVCEAARQLGRNAVGIDIHPEYIALAQERTENSRKKQESPKDRTHRKKMPQQMEFFIPQNTPLSEGYFEEMKKNNPLPET